MFSRAAVRTVSHAAPLMTRSISTVGIIGAGLMGSGIAQVSAQNGVKVNLNDTTEEALERAAKAISVSVGRMHKAVQKRKNGDAPYDEAEGAAAVESVLSNIKFTTSQEEACDGADLMVEAIVEQLEPKQELFASLDTLCDENTIFATNTSSLSVAAICNGVRPDRFGGLHFFSPVPMMKLVEVVSTDETSQATTDALTLFSQTIGKKTVQCGDTPGFIVNRLLIPFMAEAVRMYERGDATAEDIDTAMKLGAGLPMGPLELTDFVGIDVTKFALGGIGSDPSLQGNPLVAPLKTLDEMVERGDLGRKSGKGFYDYN